MNSVSPDDSSMNSAVKLGQLSALSFGVQERARIYASLQGLQKMATVCVLYFTALP